APLLFSRLPSSSSPAPPHLPSFPTRRSSDLASSHQSGSRAVARSLRTQRRPIIRSITHALRIRQLLGLKGSTGSIRSRRSRGARSEEHTSELQSLTNLVCRLLLEKKTQTNHT